MKAGLIANPHARQHRKRPALLGAYGELPGVSAHVTSTLDDLPAACAALAEARPPLIAIAGGDGSLSLAISGLRAVWGDEPLPPIVPLMGGTMNMVANSIGLPSDPLATMRRLLDAPVAALPRHRRDTLVAEGRTGFIFGIGLVTNFLEVYYDGPRTGPVKAAEVLARAVVAVVKRNALYHRLFRRQPASLQLDALPPDAADWTAVLVQTIENLGIGFRPMYRAYAEPGRFHVLATDMSAVQLVNHLPLIFRGRPWPHAGMRDRLAERLQLEVSDEAMYTLDGELYSFRGRLDVVAGPSVEFVTPL